LNWLTKTCDCYSVLAPWYRDLYWSADSRNFASTVATRRYPFPSPLLAQWHETTERLSLSATMRGLRPRLTLLIFLGVRTRLHLLKGLRFDCGYYDLAFSSRWTVITSKEAKNTFLSHTTSLLRLFLHVLDAKLPTVARTPFPVAQDWSRSWTAMTNWLDPRPVIPSASTPRRPEVTLFLTLLPYEVYLVYRVLPALLFIQKFSS